MSSCLSGTHTSHICATTRFTEALSESRTLKGLSLRVRNEDGEEDGQMISMPALIPSLCRLLRGNQVLSKLTLGWIKPMIEPDGVAVADDSDILSRIARAATGHTSLQHLGLDIETNLSKESAEAIGGMLRNSPTLSVLSLRDVSIGPAALHQLAMGLQHMCSTLNKLDLSRQYTNRASATLGACAIAEGMKQNRKVEKLDVSWSGFDDEGAVAIASALSSNRSIKNIKLGVSHVCPTVETESAILKAIQRNTTLEQCSLHGFSAVTKAKKEYLLTLNRGGRRILSSQSAVPLNYWPRILTNLSDNADVLFFFLKEKHDALISRVDARPATARKRKREDEEYNPADKTV